MGDSDRNPANENPDEILEEGKTEAEIRAYMQKTYFASDEKIDLSIDIAERELEILKKIDYENGYSLYIGIPFCPTTCLYCSFTSYPLVSWRQKVDSYLDALEKELDYVAVKFGKKTSEFHLHWRGHTDNTGAISA